MNLYLFSFEKRPNSTKRPVLTSGKELTVQLKDETSFENPVFRIKSDVIGGTFTPVVFNYAYAPYWQRYYFINDWKWVNGCWECICNVDVLASFRNQIASKTAYIIRSASEWDGNIIDTFYPTKTEKTITWQGIQGDIYHTSLAEGCFVVGTISNEGTYRVGAVSYFALNLSQMASLLTYLFSSNIYSASSITEIGEGLYKSMFNPFQYIVSCMWFPFPASALGTNTGTVRVGYWSTSVQATLVNYITKEIGIKSYQLIRPHPYTSTRGNYLNYEPYTKVTLYFPPFGEIPIDTSFMQYQQNFLYGKMYIDFITGMADLRLSITDSLDPTDTTLYKIFTQRTGMVGIPIQISQVMSDYSSTGGNILGAIGSALTGNIAGVFGNIASSVESAMPKVSSTGSNGSFNEVIETPYLIVESLLPVSENVEEFGRPLCQTRTISQLSGYIQCGEADHSFTGTQAEIESVNNFMKNGFFYE